MSGGGRIYFAYVDPTDDVFSAGHVREDAEIFSIDFEHTEGNFPTVSIVMRNPKVGLLSAGRKQWAWLSWDSVGNGLFADCVPIIFGQIVGIPSDLHSETITVQYLAKPTDYGVQQAAVGESLKVLPYYDPVWLQDSLSDPDTVLEGYSALWHVDRLTHDVTVSDIISGEDGFITVEETDHFYPDMSVSFSQVPLLSVQIEATVSWAQTGSGVLDITDELVAAFKDAGSPLSSPYVASLTGDGLLSSWPTPQTSMGGGWTVAAPTAAFTAPLAPKSVVLTYSAQSQFADPVSTDPSVQGVAGAMVMYSAVYPIGQLGINFTAEYDANRNKSEIVTATMLADVQEVFTAQVSSGQDSIDVLQLSSNFVDKAIDIDGGIPIGDPGLPTYFKTDRGQLSLQYVFLVARARLLSRARCCEISIKTEFDLVALADLSCRMNVVLNDGRLPGGTAQGKVIAYALHADASGGRYGTITIACTIGNGGAVSASAGDPVYALDEDSGTEGYMLPGYQQRSGAVLDVVAGALTYEDFSDFLIDDDGLDLQNMNPDRVIRSITVENGLTGQIAALQAGKAASPPDPSTFLKDAPTTVMVDLVPVTGGAFVTEFAPVISELKVPKTLDLSAS